MRIPAALPSRYIAPEVESLVGKFLNLARRKQYYSYSELESVIEFNPMVASAFDSRISLTISALGDYTHPDEAIQDDVRLQIANMDGEWGDIAANIMSYVPYGFSVLEKRYSGFGEKAVLRGMRRLNPDRCRFEGRNGQIEHVVYTNIHGEEARIKYPAVLHITNQAHLKLDGTDPRGIPALQRIKPLHDAYNLMLAALVVASQRQATPITVLKTDLGAKTPMLDAQGRPLLDTNGVPILIDAGEAAQEQLANLENGSSIAISREDEFIAVTQQSDGKLLLQGIDLLLGMMSLSALVPRSLQLTNAGGVGDATLADAQYKVFKELIALEIKRLSGALIESLIKPMLQWNYGDLDDYGTFPVIEEKATEASQIITSIGNAISNGAIAADEDVLGMMKQYAIRQLS